MYPLIYEFMCSHLGTYVLNVSEHGHVCDYYTDIRTCSCMCIRVHSSRSSRSVSGWDVGDFPIVKSTGFNHGQSRQAGGYDSVFCDISQRVQRPCNRIRSQMLAYTDRPLHPHHRPSYPSCQGSCLSLNNNTIP